MKKLVNTSLLMAIFVAALATSASGAKRTVPRKPHPVTGVCNINTAPLSKLTILPYVGRSRAKAIIQHRKAHPFRQAKDITKIKGIGRSTFQKLKKHITITGPTTIRKVKPTNKKSTHSVSKKANLSEI